MQHDLAGHKQLLSCCQNRCVSSKDFRTAGMDMSALAAMFGGAGGGGGFGAALGGGAPPVADPETAYASQLTQLQVGCKPKHTIWPTLLVTDQTSADVALVLNPCAARKTACSCDECIILDCLHLACIA